MRIDNTDKIVIEFFNLEFYQDDPGATPPIDLCSFCATNWEDALEVDHPPYENTDKCFQCGEPIFEMLEG